MFIIAAITNYFSRKNIVMVETENMAAAFTYTAFIVRVDIHKNTNREIPSNRSSPVLRQVLY